MLNRNLIDEQARNFISQIPVEKVDKTPNIASGLLLLVAVISPIIAIIFLKSILKSKGKKEKVDGRDIFIFIGFSIITVIIIFAFIGLLFIRFF
ncbi:MAG: hypothetical protein IKP28_04000 [Clostridia bacterium]|nr:hypothetical protein [Clostridia bacterium]